MLNDLPEHLHEIIMKEEKIEDLPKIKYVVLWLCLLLIVWVLIVDSVESFAIIVYFPLMFILAWFVGKIKRCMERDVI